VRVRACVRARARARACACVCVCSAKYGCCFYLLNFVLSLYVAQVLSELF